MKAKAVNGVVRHNDQRIKFSCKYSKNGTVSLLGYKPIYTITDEIGKLGCIVNFVSFHLYRWHISEEGSRDLYPSFML